MDEQTRKVLIDAEMMLRNELIYIKTGKHPGREPMRNVKGQWDSLLRDIQRLLEA